MDLVSGIIKSIKYELNPTNSQKQKFNQTFGNCRFVYNSAYRDW